MTTPRTPPLAPTAPPLLPDHSPTVRLMLEVAERLFAEYGVESVTLNRIVEESGQRNRSALHYHFGNRAELVTQLLLMRLAHINRIRHRRFDELEAAGGASDVRAIVRTAILPLFDVVRDEPWGVSYVKVLAQASMSPALRFAATNWPEAVSAVTRAQRLLATALPGIAEDIVVERWRCMNDVVIFSTVRALSGHDAEVLTSALLGQLVDFCAGGMMAPVTPA